MCLCADTAKKCAQLSSLIDNKTKRVPKERERERETKQKKRRKNRKEKRRKKRGRINICSVKSHSKLKVHRYHFSNSSVTVEWAKAIKTALDM